MGTEVKAARSRTPAEWRQYRAERHFRDASQVWIRFAEALKADGIKLGQYEGLDKFERFLWERYEKAKKGLSYAEKAAKRAAEVEGGEAA